MDAKIKYAKELEEVKEHIANTPDYFETLDRIIDEYKIIADAVAGNDDDVLSDVIMNLIIDNNADLEDANDEDMDDLINQCKDIFVNKVSMNDVIEYCKICQKLDVNDDDSIIAAFLYDAEHESVSYIARLIGVIQELYCINGQIFTESMLKELSDKKMIIIDT